MFGVVRFFVCMYVYVCECVSVCVCVCVDVLHLTAFLIHVCNGQTCAGSGNSVVFQHGFSRTARSPSGRTPSHTSLTLQSTGEINFCPSWRHCSTPMVGPLLWCRLRTSMLAPQSIDMREYVRTSPLTMNTHCYVFSNNLVFLY